MVVLEEAQEAVELGIVDSDVQRLRLLAKELVRGLDADEEAGDVIAVPGVVRIGDHGDPIGVRAGSLFHLFTAGDLEQVDAQVFVDGEILGSDPRRAKILGGVVELEQRASVVAV